MSILWRHWSFDPIIVVLAATAIWHEVGLRRLLERTADPSRRHRRRVRSLVFYGGLALTAVAIVSPLDYWSSSYFYVHMIDHVVAAFFVPMLIVGGAPWTPLLFGLPVGARRKVGRFFFLSRRAAVWRGIGRVIRDPWVAVIGFSGIMVLWHIPVMFDLAENNNLVHVWLMHGSFLVFGTLFWLQIIPSSPTRPARGGIWQIGAIIFVNLVMTILAMSMSILTTTSWYSVYAHVPGVSLAPFPDQQIGAAILWVCGDFWALPTLSVVIRRTVEREGSFSNLVDRVMSRRSANWITRGVTTEG